MKNIFSLTLIIVAVIVFFGYIKPTYSSINSDRAALDSYKETIKKAEELDNMVKGRKKKVEQLKTEHPDEMAKLDKLIPDTISNVNLIIDINTIAREVGLRISNIALEQVKPIENAADAADNNSVGKVNTRSGLYDSIDLSFNVSASYENFQSFITALEKSLRLVDIIKVSFRPTDNQETYSYTVTLRTYWLK